MVLLYTRGEDHHFKTFTKCSTLLQVYYLQIRQQPQTIHITHNVSLHKHTIRPYILHWNTCYCPSYPSWLNLYKKSDLGNTVNYIHTDTKYDFKSTNKNITAINNIIAAILATLADTNNKKNKQEEKITDISSKLSTYEDRLDKMSINETQLQPLTLWLKNKQDYKITELSSKLSTYEDFL